MRVSIQRVRRLDLPWVLIAILAAWGAMVAAIHIAAERGADTPSLCHFRSLTGVPCPTCGGTRAAFALFRLHPLEAAAYNPLLALAVGVTGVYLLARTLAGRGVRVEWTKRSRVTAWALFALAFCLNWAWVIHRLG